jgi:hypothetical protein
MLQLKKNKLRTSTLLKKKSLRLEMNGNKDNKKNKWIRNSNKINRSKMRKKSRKSHWSKKMKRRCNTIKVNSRVLSKNKLKRMRRRIKRP